MVGTDSRPTGRAKGSRRAPAPEERQRDAERSRQRLLAAALDEFSARGFAGARVGAIAERAGLNQQLITYYFGGKEGLYRALGERWLEQEASLVSPETPLDELAAAARGHYEAAIAAQRAGDWSRYGEELRRLGEVLERMRR